MKLDKTSWKTEKWSVHPETPHAIMIPGWGSQQLMRLIDMLYVENPRLEQTKEVSAENYARVSVTEEKVEPPPGKRKIVL